MVVRDRFFIIGIRFASFVSKQVSIGAVMKQIIVFLLICALNAPYVFCADNYELTAVYPEYDDIVSAPAQAVRTSINPCALVVSVLAIVGAAALILDSNSSSTTHSSNT